MLQQSPEKSIWRKESETGISRSASWLFLKTADKSEFNSVYSTKASLER